MSERTPKEMVQTLVTATEAQVVSPCEQHRKELNAAAQALLAELVWLRNAVGEIQKP